MGFGDDWPLEPGNIDLANRPIVKNTDGTISTIRSMSFNDGQQEVLVPTISDDGKELSPNQAIQQYLSSGRHLGKFSTPDSATKYAKQLHDQQERMHGGRGMSNGSDFSILNTPKEFSNPTGLANPDMLAAPTMTATAADSGGMDWNKIVQGIAMAGMAGMSAGRGDTMAGFRMTQLMQENERRNQDQKMQQDQAELQKLSAFPNVLELIDEAQNEPDEAKRSTKLKTISPLISRIYPDMTEESIANLANGGGGKVADLIKAIPAASKILSPKEQTLLSKQLSKDPVKARKEISTRALQHGLQQIQKGEEVDPDIEAAVIETADRKELNERQGSFNVARLIASAGTEQGKDLKSMSLAELTKIAPGLKHATNDQLGQLITSGFTNVKTLGMIEGEARDRLSSAREDKRETARDENAAIVTERLERFHQDNIAMQQRNFNRLVEEGRLDRAAQVERQDRIDKRQQEQFQSTLHRPLEQTDRTAVAAMEENLIVAKQLKAEFTPEDLKKYVGIINNPKQRAMQALKDDPKFARFRALTDKVKGFAFAEGGKALTETEKQITWGHLPVGNEFSVGNYVANLDQTIDRTSSIIDRRIQLATTPRNRIQSRTGDPTPPPPASAPQPAKPAASAAPARPRAVNKQTGEVMEWDGKAWVKVK
jgi:hypothetical protein